MEKVTTDGGNKELINFRAAPMDAALKKKNKKERRLKSF